MTAFIASFPTLLPLIASSCLIELSGAVHVCHRGTATESMCPSSPISSCSSTHPRWSLHFCDLLQTLPELILTPVCCRLDLLILTLNTLNPPVLSSSSLISHLTPSLLNFITRDGTTMRTIQRGERESFWPCLSYWMPFPPGVLFLLH